MGLQDLRLTDNIPPSVNCLVLVVSSTEESSRRIESHLRNAGYPIRTRWVSGWQEIESFLAGGAPDLLICSTQMESPAIAEIVELCRRLLLDLPVLALGPNLGGKAATAALASGARDLVCDADPICLRHLELVYTRELADHATRRQLRNVCARLSDFESRHLQFVAGTVDAVLQTQEGIISRLNQAFASLLGYGSADELIGLPLMDIVHPDHQARVKDLLKRLGRGRRLDDEPLECRLRDCAGESVEVSARLSTGTIDGESFIEMLVRAEASAPAVAPVGEDAALPDRSAFLRALEAPDLRANPGVAIALVLVALDQSEAIEARIGFHDSEQLALQVAASLRDRLGDDATGGSGVETVYRFSSFEFAALIHRASTATFEPIPEQLRKEFTGKIVATREHETTVSVSVVVYPMSALESTTQILNAVVREARELLAKGGNRAALLGPAAKANAQEQVEAQNREHLRKAIADNRFVLTYQPIASLEGDTRHYFDVLVRMVDEKGDEHYAAEFIQVAEKYGLMKAIDRLVVVRALQVLAKREGGSASSMLFVKISEDTLRDADAFIGFVQESLVRYPLGGNAICFETQELILQNHIRKGKILMRALRDAGASIAIEHFGLGSNSIHLLDHIPATFLKFDKSFTRNFSDRETQRKMSTLMEVAKQRHIKTIVSHVEDANIMARMWQMGVNYIQGFHVQEPEVVMMSADVRM